MTQAAAALAVTRPKVRAIWAQVRFELRQATEHLPEVQHEALAQRCAAAHALLDQHACDAACEDDPFESLLALAQQRWSDGPERVLAVLWLAVAARLPSGMDSEDMVWQIEAGRPHSARSLAAALVGLGHEHVVHRLVVLPQGSLLVEVTHTYAHAWLLTGIQRVVRGLVGALDAAQVTLVRVDVPGRLAVVPDADWHAQLQRGDADSAARGADAEVPLATRARNQAIKGLLAARKPLLTKLQQDPAFANSVPVRVGRRAVRTLIAQQGTAYTAPDPRAVDVVACLEPRLLLPELTATEDGVETMLRWAHAMGARLNMVFYDAIPLTHPQYCLDSLVSGLAKYGRLLRTAAHVMPISHAAAASARALVALEGPAEVPVTAVPLPGAAVVGEKPHDAGLRRDPRLLLCVSSLEPRKNHVRLLRATRRLLADGEDFRLVLVGGSGWMSERIDAEIEQARAEGVDVEVKRGLPDDELADLYDRARAVVFVSEVEGYGLPIVEALAHGTPVVCSDAGSMAEVAEAGGCLLVDAYDIGAVADGLHRILNDDELHETLRTQALAREAGSWAAYSEALLAIVGPAEDPDLVRSGT